MIGPSVRADGDWQMRHARRVATPEAAVARIKPGQRLFVGTGCGEPRALVRALATDWRRLPDTELVYLVTFGDPPYLRDDIAAHFHVNTFFIGDNIRDIVHEGRADYTPMLLSEIPALLRSGKMPLDAALVHVSPPDDGGYCSLGVSVDIVRSAIESSALVIAQVNPRMPRTSGNTLVHVDDLDVLVPVDEPLPEVVPPEPTEVTGRVAEFVAGLVEDGATIELGFGRIPQAVPRYLLGRTDLGIHTEVVTDAIIDLIEAGCVTGARKTLDRGKVVASFCLGTSRLYELIDNNPQFAFHPTEYVNDPEVIGRQHNMVAINVALQVDLTGQVCADSLGSTFYSGIGGQADFIRGAARAPGGKAIIALPSTARGDAVSRIVTHLSPGAGVVTTRGDVHYVVTEHGVAYLHGKSVHERVLALISIAHPDFRSRLLTEAVEARYVHPEIADVEGRIVVAPPGLRTTCLLEDGTQVAFRPVHPTDEAPMRRLFNQLSQETLYRRFVSRVSRVPRKQVQDFVYIDHRAEVGIVGVLPVPGGDEIIAAAGYYLDPRANRAEVAFVVADAWQGHGLGSFMFRHLASIARRNGIRGLTAEVLVENQAMQAVFTNSGLKVRADREDDMVSFVMDFP